MYDENDDRINTPAGTGDGEWGRGVPGGANGEISPRGVETFYLSSLYRTSYLASRRGDLCLR